MRYPKRGVLAATLLVLFVLERASAEQEGKDRGFFRFGCTPLVTAPVDPIPGNGEGFFKHPHYVFGSDAMAPYMTEDSVTNLLEKSTCTTCNVCPPTANPLTMMECVVVSKLLSQGFQSQLIFSCII